MFYKEILEALKTKFTGVSENILSRQARKLEASVTAAEQVKTVVDGITLQQLIDSYADSRANEATQTAVHNYESKYGLKDGKALQQHQGDGVHNQQPPVTNQQTKQQGGAESQTDKLLQQLIEQNNKLTERLNRMDGERTTATRRQQLAEVTSKLPESIREAYNLISLDGMSEDDFKTLVGKVTTQVETIAKETQTRGAVFGRPGIGAGTSNVQGGELTPEQKAAIEHRASIPKAGEQPF